MQSLYTASTGLEASQKKLGVIANNIANVNTTGFKKSRVNFESLLHQKLRQPGQEVGDATMPSGLSIGVGVRVGSTQEMHSQGGLQQTGANFDMAISGNGMFQVILPSGETAYTRSGNFLNDGEGNVVTTQGYLLEPQIAVPENAIDISISNQGVVAVRLQGEPELQEIGNIELARFVNPAGLENKGSNVYVETAASGAPIVSAPGEEGTGEVLQGQLETSNVNIAEEMVEMINGQRAYEMASKVVTSSSQMIQKLNEVTG